MEKRKINRWEKKAKNLLDVCLIPMHSERNPFTMVFTFSYCIFQNSDRKLSSKFSFSQK